MGRKNYWKSNPYSREMIEESNRVCCVSGNKKRKKRWTDKAEAAAVALICNGKYYACMFHRGTYHVTTTTHRKPVTAGEYTKQGDPDAKITKLYKKMEATVKELEAIQAQVTASSFRELKQVSLELLNRKLHRENTIRQLGVELAALRAS